MITLRLAMLCVLCLMCGIPGLKAQLFQKDQRFSRADSLRGYLSEDRTCYDVKYYDLSVEPGINAQRISGVNIIRFKVLRNTSRIQLDLFRGLKIDYIRDDNGDLPFTREEDAVFITFPDTLKVEYFKSIRVAFSGEPKIALNAPWDGGLIFSKDENGRPWISSACQGIGASMWWPNKDHQSDEPDSVSIRITVPSDLTAVSNGRLRKVEQLEGARKRYNWFVSNPINNYNVSMNVGDYIKTEDEYRGEKGSLDLSYWTLRAHRKQAGAYFGPRVKSMLRSFEHWFGPYPFYEDGYQLIETPFLGMEHQSGIAYGNKFQQGYLGRDLSSTGWGLKWDFIIVHESGHEWFGNNITSRDIADMWVHESFTSYSESLFIESEYGKQAAAEYIHGLRAIIRNDVPVIGHYGVNQEGSGDMYYKGSNMLHCIRTILNDDEKWRQILRGLNQRFYHKTVEGEELIKYINEQSGRDFTLVFDQYLKHTSLPTLELQLVGARVCARWISEVPGFTMPVRLRLLGQEYKWFSVGPELQPLDIGTTNLSDIEADTFNFYISVLKEQGGKVL